MNLTHKIDFAVVFKVRNANPNGDPLNGNRPRTTYTGLGEVSDVCIKRKIRNRLMEKGHDIFVQSDDNRVDEHINLRSRAEAFLPSKGSSGEKAQKACEKWFDVRAFGQVLAFSGKKKGEGLSIGIRGPVSIHSAFSLDPVDVTSIQITKSVSTEGDGSKKGSDTMGMKHCVDHGIYVFYGTMNPQLASKTGFNNEDADVVKALLPKLFENDASSARPEGSMEVMKVVWWQHNCPNGQLSSAKVHQSLQVEKDGSISFHEVENCPEPEVIDGF